MTSQNGFYGFTSLTGGAIGNLDYIDGSTLSQDDGAFGFDSAYGFLVYKLSATSGAAESLPDIVTPDNNAGSRRWILQTLIAGGYTSTGDLKLLDGIKLLLGDDEDGEIYESSGDLYIKNATTDKDIIFKVSDGGIDTEVVRIDGSDSNVILSNTLQLGTDTTFKSFYASEGDLYSEIGKAFFGAGINVRAERYGIAWQSRESSPSKTLPYDVDATFTAATGVITKAGETFLSDGVAVKDFLVLTNASDAEYIGSTGEITDVTETAITISLAAAGAATPADLTGVDFIVINHPIAVFLDNGDVHFDIGVHPDARFHLNSSEANGSEVLRLECESNIDGNSAQGTYINANGFNSVSGHSLFYNSGELPAGESGAGHVVQLDVSNADDDATSKVSAYIAGTTNSSDVETIGYTALAGFKVAFRVQGGSSESPDYGYEVSTGSVVDRVNSGGGGNDAFVSAGTNVQIFDADDDYILIGNVATFEIIDWIANIPASATIIPTFEYSTGNGTWAALTITNDGTNGFTTSGQIIFTAPGGWAAGNEAEAPADITSAYYIRITRTRNFIVTAPTEELFTIFLSGSLGLDIRGDGSIKPAQLTDASAENDSIYNSSTQSKLVYKDSGGTVNVLY